MKSYGLDMQHSDINSRASEIVSGNAFPYSPQNGSVFFLTQDIEGYPRGHYFYTGTEWKMNGDILSVSAGPGLKGGGFEGELTLALDTDFVVLDADKRLYDTNRIAVRKDPGKGQFASVSAALASITDNSIAKTYQVEIGPGVFDESQIIAKPFVFIKGAGAGSTILRAANPNDHFIIGSARSAISDVTITGATGLGSWGTGVASIYYANPTGDTNLAFLVEDVKFAENHTHILCTSGNVLVVTCTFGSIFPFVRGFVVQDDGVHQARISMRASSTSGMTTPYPQALFSAIGAGSQILLVGVVARASSATNTASNIGVGLHLANGGRCRVVGTSLVGFNKGIWCENAGAAPYMSCVGINLESNTQDLVVDHPNTTGSYTGVAIRSKTYINPSANITILYSDLEQPGTIGVGPLYLGPDHNNLANVSPLITNGLPLGLLSGGELSRLGGLQVKLTAGVGYAKNGDILVRVEWPDTVFNAVANSGTSYVFVDLNGVVSTSSTAPDQYSHVICGRYLAGASNIIFIGSLGAVHIGTFSTNIERMHQLAIGPVYVSGSVVTPCQTVVRGLDVTAGHYFYGSEERHPDPGMTIGFLAGYYVAGQKMFAYLTQVPNTSYNNGTDLVPLTASYYTKHVLYTNGDGVNVGYALAYGTGNYATKAEAEQAPLPNPVERPDGSPAIAAIIMQQGNDSIVEIQDLRPRVGFNAASTQSIVTHGDLLGLTADDHKQYMRVDGTRAMQGPLDMNGHGLTNVLNINGLDLTKHAPRHMPNGVDPLTTAAPTTPLSPSTQNAVGTANSFARSDHTHSLSGVQAASAELSAVAGLNTTGIVKRTGASTWSAGAVNLASDVTGKLSTNNIGTGTLAADTFLAGDGNWKQVPGIGVAFYYGKAAVGSSTTVIGYDTSTPLSTEGTQLWTKTVTPGGTTSSFAIAFTTMIDCASNATRYITFAIFRGTTCVGTIAAAVQTGWPSSVTIQVVDIPGTTNPVTYSCRAGINTSGITWYVGRGSSATLGGTSAGVWTITENQ